MKTTKILLNIMSVICFIYGAFYLFSLVFIPIAVYCFLAGKRFSYKAEHLYDTFTVTNETLKNYTIFVCIVCFPLGLLALIPYYLIVSNNVKISGFKVSSGDDVETQEVKVEDVKVEPVDQKEEVKTEVEKQPKEVKESVETEEEKLEKFKKLQNFKDKGIITEEELEMAREQLFGKKDN